MSLRSKIVILLSAVVLLYAGLDHILQRTVVFDSFVALENAAAQKDVLRVEHALQTEIDILERECEAWAKSSDGYRVASAGDNPVFVEKAQMLQKQQSSSIHLVYVCDTKGKTIYSSIHTWGRNSDVELHLKEFPEGSISDTNPLLLSTSKGNAKSGFYMTEAGALMVAAEPIVGPNGGPWMGTFITGRFLGPSVVSRLEEATEVQFELWPCDDPAMPADALAVRAEADALAIRAEPTDGPVLRAVDDEHLSAYKSILDVGGYPALLVRANLRRDVTAQGSLVVRYALVSTIAAGLLLILVLLNMVQRTVLKPLGQLTDHAVEIGRSEDFTKRIRSDRKDEVGILAREFDGMIEKVAQSRAALVGAARAAGMSEIATGVLHNVGNVLNSVNVSAHIAVEKARASSGADLRKVMDILRPSRDDIAGFIARDPRGKHLYTLLDSLTEKLVAEQATLLRELGSLTEGVAHIKELVQSQQGYAGRAGVREILTLSEQIEAAISITSQATSGSNGVEIVREFEHVPAVAIERHRLMEILVNLIQNARQSVAEAKVPRPQVNVRLARLDEYHLRIEVVDNGIGISPENLARVFTYGFTTKKNGHGFGLHASANAATEMGVQLSVHSDGKGRGATFALDIPIQVPTMVGALA